MITEPTDVVIIEHRFLPPDSSRRDPILPPVQEQPHDGVRNQAKDSKCKDSHPPSVEDSKCEDSRPPSMEDKSVSVEDNRKEELYVPYALIAKEEDEYSYSYSYSESESALPPPS